MSRQVLLTFLASCAAFFGSELHGEVFVLTHGGKIEGRWINREDGPHETYEIETLDGGRITLSAGQVEEVIVKSENLRRYEEALPKVSDTLEGHWDMAERCRKAGLKPQREYHLRKVIQFDPNHAKARYGLGYSRVDGEWTRADEWLQEQGLVRYKGAWRLPQEVELDARRERRAVEEKEWRKRLRVWRSSIVRGRNDSAQALEQIQAIDSSLAIAALAELLNDAKEPTQLKFVYIEVLGRFNSSAAAAALLERVMKDSNLEVAERCIDKLKVRGTSQALSVLSRTLDEKDNAVVNRGGWALGQLGQPKAIPALIDAVVTTHRFKVQGGNPGSMTSGFSPTNGNSFQTGSRTQILEKELPNQQVLAALTALTPDGVNFGYDKPAWKKWYALERAQPGIDLRRDF